MFYGGGGPLSLLFGILSSIVSIVAGAVAFIVVVGLLFLLVRFLWFGTRAAQIYLVKNGESGRFSWPVPPVGEPLQQQAAAAAPQTPPAAPATPATPQPEPTPEPASGAAEPSARSSAAAEPQQTTNAPDATVPYPRSTVIPDATPTEVLPGNAAPVPPNPPARAPRKPKTPPGA